MRLDVIVSTSGECPDCDVDIARALVKSGVVAVNGIVVSTPAWQVLPNEVVSVDGTYTIVPARTPHPAPRTPALSLKTRLLLDNAASLDGVPHDTHYGNTRHSRPQPATC